MDILVGDFDILQKNKGIDVAYRSLGGLITSISFFIDRFVEEGEKESYLQLIKDRLCPDVGKDEVFTDNGVKLSCDFDFEKDTVVKRGEITEVTTDEQLAKIVSKQTGKNYEPEDIARTADDITEKTRYYMGDLSNEHEHVLTDRTSPLCVEGDVDFKYNHKIKSIPIGLSVLGDVSFLFCDNLESIGEGFSVGGGRKFYGL